MRKITPKKQKAISALLRSPTIEKAAQEAGVGYSTLRGWLKDDDEFRREYERALGELVADAATLAKKSMSPALATMREVLEDHYTSDSIRIQAGRALMDYALKLVEITDVMSRIEALEKQLEDENHARIT